MIRRDHVAPWKYTARFFFHIFKDVERTGSTTLVKVSTNELRLKVRKYVKGSRKIVLESH